MDTIGATRKTLIDLLDLEYVFSQHSLLSVEEFREACNHRGIWLSHLLGKRQLEALHRAGVLVPAYRVIKDLRRLRAWARRNNLPDKVGMMGSRAGRQNLRAERDAGRVRDPRAEGFTSWRRCECIIDGSRIQTSEFLYSPYQLLLITNVGPFVPMMKARHVAKDDYSFRLVLPERKLARAREERERNDELVIVLSSLDRVYRSNITGTISLPLPGTEGEEEWQAFEDKFDPTDMLTWLGWTPERIRAEAERLLTIASRIDPLNAWLPLIRLCRPEKWERLRGDALIAIDHRIAAEILLRFYDDLVDAGVAPALPQIPRFAPHPLQERLKGDRNALDTVLMDFGLSPQPSLILFLEGETEMEIVPRVLDRLAVRWPRSFIEIHNAYGVKANIGRIASYLAPLAFGEDHGDFVELTRPAARILAVFDRENALSDDEKIRGEKQKWVTEFLKTVPEAYRTPAIQEALHTQIEVVTWNEGSFEFAHFSNEELCTALLSLCAQHGIVDAEVELWRIETARVQKQGIQTYLPNKVKKYLSKPALAGELWPVLERKISAAIEADTLDSIPIVRMLRMALDNAITVHRSDVGMLVRRPEDSAAA